MLWSFLSSSCYDYHNINKDEISRSPESGQTTDISYYSLLINNKISIIAPRGFSCRFNINLREKLKVHANK